MQNTQTILYCRWRERRLCQPVFNIHNGKAHLHKWEKFERDLFFGARHPSSAVNINHYRRWWTRSWTIQIQFGAIPLRSHINDVADGRVNCRQGRQSLGLPGASLREAVPVARTKKKKQEEHSGIKICACDRSACC